MVSNNSPDKRRIEFSYRQRKLNVSRNLCHEEYTQKLDYFLVDNKPEPWDDSEPSAVVRKNFDHEYFNLMNLFLVSLVISFVGSRFKLLRMSWYKYMTPFRDHLHLVIKKYVRLFHN